MLLVENLENNLCALLANIFQSVGFETELPTTLAGCVEAVRAGSVDVVLMVTNNILNPSAFTIAETLRGLQPNCGFVFLSGNDHDGRDGFLAAGYKFRIHDIPMAMPELQKLAVDAVDHPAETFVIPKKEI